MPAVVLVVVVASAAVLVGFLAYLTLLAFIVVRTNSTSGLRDVAVAVRAFRGVLTVRSKP